MKTAAIATTVISILAVSAIGGLVNAAIDTERPAPPPVVAVLDANRDFVIDADEIAGAPAALRRLDKDGDGALTPLELRPPLPPRDGEDRPEPAMGRGRGPGGPGGPGRRGPGCPIIKALDKNADMTVSAEEIAGAPAALLTLDKNSDGQLTKDEICPPPPAGGEKNGRGKGRGR